MTSPERYSAVTATIRGERARALLEVGTWNGDRALAMAEAGLQESSKVFYAGFDLFEDMTGAKSKTEFNVKTPSPEAQVHGKLEAFRQEHPGFSFMLHKGDTKETLRKFVSTYGAGKIDLVWLDGGHSVETIASDWWHCRKAVRPGGVILLDDYYSGVDRDFLKKFGCNTLVGKLMMDGQKVVVLPAKDPVRGGGFVQIVKVWM